MTQENQPRPLETGGDEPGLIETFQKNPTLALAAGVGVLIVATLVAYAPALRGQFIWDDDYHVVNNTLLRDLPGLQRIWFGVIPSPQDYALPQYYPVTHTSFWIEYRLWGLNSTGYHVTNVLLHICNALLIWLILRRLDVPGAFVAAGIFAIHPLNVESVAWIAERKNVLCGFFFFSSLYIYLRYAAVIPRPRASKEYLTLPDDPTRVYAIALLLFVFALGSKTIAASLPAVVLLLIWWKRGAIRLKHDLLPLVPFFVLGIAAASLTGWMEVHRVGARGPEWEHSIPQHIVLAGRIAWFYVGKLIFPHPLNFNYPRWTIHASDPVQWIYPAGVVAVVGILWFARGYWGRGPLVAVLYYLGTLVPAMGFVRVLPMRYSYVADHFAYLSIVGLIALACASVWRVIRTCVPARESAVGIGAGLAAVLMIVLFARTNSRAGVYENSETIWTDTWRAGNKTSWMAANNYGELLLRTKPDKIDAAEAWFHEAIRLKPDHAEARYNLGQVAQLRGNLEEAARWYAQAIERRENYNVAVYRLAFVRELQGRLDDAEQHYRQAIQMNPRDLNAYLVLGQLLEKQGRLEDAIAQYEKAGDVDPSSALPFIKIGVVLWKQQKHDEAMLFFGRARQLDPTNPLTARNIATAFAASGYFPMAEGWFRQAVDLDPSSAETRRLLGMVLAMQGKTVEARQQLQKAIELDPDLEQARANLKALDEGRIVPATTQSATQSATQPTIAPS